MYNQKFLQPKYLNSLNRRDFLRVSAASLGSLALKPWKGLFELPDFPQGDQLGRVCDGRIDIKIQPDFDSQTVGVLFEDAVVPWNREVLGRWPWRNNQRWVETPDGYIWCPYLQPVKNEPATPVAALPQLGAQVGLWAEVCVPYVDAIIANGPPRSAWWKFRQENGQPFRFYYSQVLWIDDMQVRDDGSVMYRVNERYGNPGDIFWCDARAFRPLTEEELSPISPGVEDKRIMADIAWDKQTLSCYEGETEVFFCRISSGKAEGATPLTPAYTPGFMIWRKLFSLHMGGSTAAGSWDVPAVGWTSLFHGDGVAVHSTYWHNNYGEPMSHGCLNARPKDAKWIFRWANPATPFNEGDITISGDGGTRVIVNEF